ncbi:hypothetical protein QBC35DRAFT_100552 [Podospora australis]|uniref:Uncharacterized protein n=1 Tax=Podospora australis TaxID=1536484 RepID=A0AAN6X6Y9_9PEZI|nr:hypothetical protein QBC35DRAFT_100552 [Podospora australis]
MSPPYRIPVIVTFPIPGDAATTTISRIQRRTRYGGNSTEAKIIGIVLGSLFGLIIVYFIAKHLYNTCILKKPHAYKQAQRQDDDCPTVTQIHRENQDNLEDALAETQARNGTTTTPATGTPGVDRNTSVRSVMTLPVYRPKPTENEQVLGREGERDGIDVVVEMPTAEQEEAMREQEMDSLYQIRAARRRQVAEREERRRLRREAREANDVVAMRELRERGRSVATLNVLEVENLRAEHERIKETRQRAISSVSYADVGIARADGTRIRANSTDSERIGLLSDAASMSASTNADSLLQQRRDRSESQTTLSIDTTHRPSSPGLTTGGSTYSLASAGLSTRSRANSGATTPRIPGGHSRAGSSPEIIEAEGPDLGDFAMPPPDYDEVSLDDVTPMHSRRNSGVSAISAVSGRNSPYNEPPPDYPGPARSRSNRLSAQMGDLANQAQSQPAQTTQLPQLRLSQVPQIVIEPSSARP